MAPFAWSTRLLKAYIADTTQVFTVPAGKRAVVRCISAYNAGATGGLAYVQVAYSTVWVRTVPGGSMAESAGLHHVAHSGETISAYIQGPTMNLTVSGYLLEDPSSSPAPNVDHVRLDALPADQMQLGDVA